VKSKAQGEKKKSKGKNQESKWEETWMGGSWNMGRA
jgi:hypothetical protein